MMNEVLDTNYHELYPEIESAIKGATFIAIDTEFTGIYSEDVKFSYFDSLNDRYLTLKKNIEPFSIVQFGIAVFKHDRHMNAYAAQCYKFYLFPRTGSFKNIKLSWQATALEFLSRYKFDFNKLINNGISYVNEEDAWLIKKQIYSKFIQNGECLTYEEETLFQNCIHKVNKWIEHDKDEISFKLKADTPLLRYMLHKYIRNNYANVWTTSGNKCVDVIRITQNVGAHLQREDNDRTEEELFQWYIGFSAVFNLLVSSKKPLVGHNILLDLMFMHKQFYKQLPDNYEKFKMNVHNLFPEIYDTKHLSFQLQNLLGKDEVNWKISSLCTLYEYFTSGKGQHMALSSPTVYLTGYIVTDERSYHSAAWDSYYAGYIFVKMAHMFSVQKFGPGLGERHVTNSELMSSVRKFKNCLNIARGNELYMQLGGQDPIMSRPEWLHVKLKSPCVNTKQLTEKLSSFCTMDIKPLSRRGFLVAVSTRKSALHILRHFQNSSEFQVTRYNCLRHAPLRTVCLWSGLALTGSCLLAWAMKHVFLK